MNPLSWFDVDRAAFTLDLDLGPLQFSTTGRAVFFFYVTMGLLAVGGLAVAVSGKAELRRRWLTWALIAPVVGLPIWAGHGPTAVLAAVLAVQAVREFSKLVELPGPERRLLYVLAVAYPLAAWLAPNLLALAPLVALACALPSLLAGDSAHGLRRAALAAFARSGCAGHSPTWSCSGRTRSCSASRRPRPMSPPGAEARACAGSAGPGAR